MCHRRVRQAHVRRLRRVQPQAGLDSRCRTRSARTRSLELVQLHGLAREFGQTTDTEKQNALVPDILHRLREVRPLTRSSFSSGSSFHRDARPRLHSQNAPDRSADACTARSGGTLVNIAVLHLEIMRSSLLRRVAVQEGPVQQHGLARAIRQTTVTEKQNAQVPDFLRRLQEVRPPTRFSFSSAFHFIVTLVLVYIPGTHRTGARPRAQQDRAGFSRHDRYPPPEDQAQQYFFLVLLFRKVRTFLGFKCTSADGITGYLDVCKT